eukprot:4016127-Amphidinium_carterae.1
MHAQQLCCYGGQEGLTKTESLVCLEMALNKIMNSVLLAARLIVTKLPTTHTVGTTSIILNFEACSVGR